MALLRSKYLYTYASQNTFVRKYMLKGFFLNEAISHIFINECLPDISVPLRDLLYSQQMFFVDLSMTFIDNRWSHR